MAIESSSAFLPSPARHPHHIYPALLYMAHPQAQRSSTRQHYTPALPPVPQAKPDQTIPLPTHLLPLLYRPPLPFYPYPQPLPTRHHYTRVNDAHQYTYYLPSPLVARLASHTPLYSLAPMVMLVSGRTRRVVLVVGGIEDFVVQRRF